MRRPSFRLSALPLGVAAGALALAACSDNIVTPTRAPGAAAHSAVVNTSSITLASDAASPNPTQFCGGTFGVFTVFAASNPVLPGACGNARDLQADGSLGVYNPGWDNPNGLTVTTGHWVGFTAAAGPSSDYRPTPGLYYFTQSFTLPTGVTAPSLTLDVLADNVAAVYLNGTKLGQQTMTDCNVGSCNWQVANKLTVTAASGLFNAPNVANTLVFVVNDVPTGFPSLVSPVGGPDPQYGCTYRSPSNGIAGFSATPVATSPNHIGPHPTGEAAGMVPTPTDNVANPTQDGCENPSGLAFAGTVSFTPAPPPQICDFITFGRLVLGSGNDKIVISGNAGGNAPDGGILGTIEISVGGTQYHVPTIESYGLTTSGVLFPDEFARVITGHSGTHLVELRLRDNPNPGQGEPGTQEGDAVWLKIDNTVIVPLQTLDKGNIQLHLHCRGPGE